MNFGDGDGDGDDYGLGWGGEQKPELPSLPSLRRSVVTGKDADEDTFSIVLGADSAIANRSAVSDRNGRTYDSKSSRKKWGGQLSERENNEALGSSEVGWSSGGGVIEEKESSLLTRRFAVPSTFMSDLEAESSDFSQADPFASDEPDNDFAGLAARKSTEEVLKEAGIQFTEGASAYFDSSTEELVVRNTDENLDLVKQVTRDLSAVPGQQLDGQLGESEFAGVAQNNQVISGYHWSEPSADGSVALAQDYRRAGKYDEAKELLNDVRFEVQKSLEYLDDPIRVNGSLTREHSEKVDEVRRLLYKGEGLYNLADYDKSEETFKKVLKIDPYNKAARRWLERNAAIKSYYYRAAYDHTRAKLLMETDKAWELTVPTEVEGSLRDELGLFSALGEAEKLGRAAQNKSEITENIEGERAANLQKQQVIETANNKFFSGNVRKESSEDLRSKLKERQEKVEELKLQMNLGRQLQEAAQELEFLKKKLAAEEAAKQAARQTQEIEALNEKDAATEGDSTFSLHVSDVSFKLAKAALEQGKWPETVRVEEFVNAFSYGERVLASNERVGVAMEQAAHPFLSQRNLLRVSLQTAATGRGAGVPLRLTVVLDKSGSMERLDRAAAVDEAFRVLMEQLNPGDKVTLIGFSRTPSLLADFVDGSEGERLLKILRETPSEGGTNVEEALGLALAKSLEHYQDGAQNRVILLTDGIANLGESVPESLMTMVEGMRKEGVAFDACGVGVEGVNDEILEALTRKGDGRYYLLGSATEGGAEFAKQVAGALRPAAQNVKVQVEWNPERVGKWRLYGFEKHELKKEDFRNDSVDAAEMAAEEEGVALYHVEVKPDGEGPLGVARVRFLDVAHNEMVEREWEIAYEGEAASLEESDARMRLAGVAGLTAEKLAKSAIGERVEWDELLEVTRQLKSVFPKEKRVKDLESMIEQAKNLE